MLMLLWSPLVGIGMIFMFWGLIFILPAAIWLFLLGCRTLKRATTQTGSYALTLYLIGAVLCEPLANLLLVWNRLVNAPRWPDAQGAILWNIIHITAPIAVVLLPAIGIFVRERIYRRALLQLLGLSLLRWLLIICAIYAFASTWDVIHWLLICLAIGLAQAVLYASIGWARQILNGGLVAPHERSIAPAG